MTATAVVGAFVERSRRLAACESGDVRLMSAPRLVNKIRDACGVVHDS